MTMTPLPDPPSVLDPEHFSDKAEAFVAALVTFQAELNTIIGTSIPAGSAGAGALTGDTLASNVLASSLTSLGTIAAFVATAANIQALSVKAQKLQSFVLYMKNESGTIKHEIISDSFHAALGSWSDKINGAAATLTVTPTGADASTAFAAGGKISSVNTSYFIFDTAAQTVVDFVGFCTLEFGRVNQAVNVRTAISSDNVNGVTRNRLAISFTEQAEDLSLGGNAIAISSLLSADTELLMVRFFGFLA